MITTTHLGQYISLTVVLVYSATASEADPRASAEIIC